jgi:hypothetical protein
MIYTGHNPRAIRAILRTRRVFDAALAPGNAGIVTPPDPTASPAGASASLAPLPDPFFSSSMRFILSCSSPQGGSDPVHKRLEVKGFGSVPEVCH